MFAKQRLAWVFDQTASDMAKTRQFWKEMVRPAGFEPATLGLEG
jgi:hypothetical protein